MFLPVKTWLLIACDTAFYAIMALITRYRYALGILAKFRPGSSAHLKLVSLFWILGPTVEDLINRERLHSHVIELEKMKRYLPSMLSALTSWS